jgi:hypothetical protein
VKVLLRWAAYNKYGADDVENTAKNGGFIMGQEGKYSIIRTFSAGVFAGNLMHRKGKEVTLRNARRLWYWDGAASLSQLAMEGTSKPENCKFPIPVKEILLTEAIEIIAVTEKAKKSIESVPIWKK